ncbi:MAG: histidine--tRNA ligase [Pseudomonadota bacterium]
MSDTKQIYKPKPVSGFLEFLPEYRSVELRWLDHIRKTFESFGYASIETPAVEELDVLLAKGETDKEIYVLNRLQADTDDKNHRLGLHFDQTVPMARYVAQHFNDLDFPFKRYQMQKVWRGERPQLGRLREFLQCDIDVINVDHLPLSFDAEMPATIYQALSGLPEIGRFQIRFSNRKILLGLLAHLGVSDTILTTRIIDKIEKIGPDAVHTQLRNDVGLSDAAVTQILDLVQVQDIAQVTPLNTQMEEGLTELSFVLSQLSHLPPHACKADLSIVRGLDYYTGTVYETRLLDIPEFTSSICSGGRYDDLAGTYINKHLPGVGISIGLTRLFDVLRHYGYIKPGPKCPTQILICLNDEAERPAAMQLAHQLRQRDMRVEVFHSDQKFKKQIQYAEKKGISHLWFLPHAENPHHMVKDLRTGQQVTADPAQWTITS